MVISIHHIVFHTYVYFYVSVKDKFKLKNPLAVLSRFSGFLKSPWNQRESSEYMEGDREEETGGGFDKYAKYACMKFSNNKKQTKKEHFSHRKSASSGNFCVIFFSKNLMEII